MAKSNWGHVHKLTREVGGKCCTFRSKLEYRYSVYLQLQKEQNYIDNWWYEDEKLELVQPKTGNKVNYLPDFTVQMADNEYEFHECKGWFPPKDAMKLKLAAQQYDNPIVLVFAKAPCTDQLRRALALENHLEPLGRIIWNADRDIFKAISHLFDC